MNSVSLSCWKNKHTCALHYLRPQLCSSAVFCIGNGSFRGTNEISLSAFKTLPNFYILDLQPLERDKKKKKKNQRNYKYTNTGRIESFGCKQRLRKYKQIIPLLEKA